MKSIRIFSYAISLAMLFFCVFPVASPAQALSSGTFNMGSISCGQSVSTVTVTTGGDQYSFYGTSGQYVTIDAVGANGYDTYLELFNASGTRVASDDDSGSGLNARITSTLTSTGTYRIIARGFSGRTGSYVITVTCGGSSSSSSSSSSSGTYNMGSISCGQSRSTVTVTSGGDQYSFSGTSGQYVTIAMNGQNNYDTYLELYNPGGSRIAYDDDGGSGLNSLLTATLPSSGTYRIIARGLGGRLGSYTITVTCSGSSSGSTSSSSGGTYNMGSISCGQTRSTSTITTGGDQYSFYGTSGQYISIAMNGQNNYDTYLELYNSSGSRIAYDDDGGAGWNSLLNTTIPSSGNYTIIARGLGGALGSYSITVTCSGSSGSTGSTGSTGTYNMGSVSCGQSISTVTITSGGDQYSFYGTSGQYVTIDAAGSNSYDTVLELYNSSGSRIASDDDSGSGLSARITTTLPSSGNYTIIARGYGGRTGSYTLSVACQSGSTSGGTTSSGTYNMGSISCGQTTSTTTITSGGDQYSFYGTSGQYISIAMNGQNSYDTYLELYNSSGNRLAYNDDGGPGLNSLIQTTLPSSGNYTIIARGLGGRLGSYSITVTCGSSGTTSTTGALCNGYYGAPYNMGSINYGQTISSVTIRQAGDGYIFNGSSGDSITINMTGINNYDTYLELYGPNCQQITTNDDGAGYPNARIQTTLNQTGTYTIIARGYSGRTGSYSLSLQRGSSGNTTTGSTGPSGAYSMGAISCGQSRSSVTISSAGDVYSFNGTANQYITIDAIGINSYDTYLELYNSSGSRIAYDDDTGTGLNAQLYGTLPSTGTYSIVVRGYSGRTGSYTLNMNCGSTGSTGSTGSSTSSCQSSYGAPYNMGSISYGQTVSTSTIRQGGDIYTFTGTAGDNISIAMNGNNGYDTYLHLFGPGCSQIGTNDDGGPGLKFSSANNTAFKRYLHHYCSWFWRSYRFVFDQSNT